MENLENHNLISGVVGDEATPASSPTASPEVSPASSPAADDLIDAVIGRFAERIEQAEERAYRRALETLRNEAAAQTQPERTVPNFLADLRRDVWD